VFYWPVARQSVIGLLLGVLIGLAGWAEEFPDPANAAAEQHFGIEAGQPITKGFLFIDSRFIRGPYIVARRGLTVYINDHFIERAFGWPGDIHQVDVDPGDPAPGTSPFDEDLPEDDPRSTYWVRKWIFLSSHFDLKIAREKMVAVYVKADFATKIEPSPLLPTGVAITRKNGRTSTIDLNDDWKREVVSDEFRLKTAIATKKRYEKTLKDGQVVGYLANGGYWQINTHMVADFFAILLSGDDEQRKVARLVEKQLLLPQDQDLRRVLLALVPDDVLRTRVIILTGSEPGRVALAPVPAPLGEGHADPIATPVTNPPAAAAPTPTDRRRPWLLWVIIGAVVVAIVAIVVIAASRRRA